ncbi:MAG: ABC transporter substrate-binding protein [Alphaproteobacteria bacterium]
MMRPSRRQVIAAGAALPIVGCAPGIKRNPQQLVVSLPSDITTLDGATTFLLPNQIAPNLCYQRLLKAQVVGGQTAGVEGDLASAWELAPDRSSMTFHLRAGQKFDDGSDVTAGAMIFTIERILKRKFPSAQALFWYDKAEAPDALTLHIKLRAYAPFVPHLLTAAGLGVVNPNIVQYAQDDDLGSAWLREHSAGSGPYRVKRIALREEVTLEPNPHFAGSSPYFTDVRLRTVKDSTVRMIELDKSDVDVLEAVAHFEKDWLRQRPGIKLVSAPAPIVLFLHVNNERPMFRDPRVRRAISLAVDRETIIKSIFRGAGQRIPGVLPPGIPGHDASLPLLGFDPVAAKALAREAGVAPGTPVTLTVVGDGGGPSATQLALREALVSIGFDVSIKQIAASARSQIFKGDFDITTQSISLDFPDPWIVFTFVYGSAMIGAGNMSRYRNPTIDKLLGQADAADGEARLDLYKQAQRIVYDELPTIPLFQTSWTIAARRSLSDIPYNFSTPMLLAADKLTRTP